MNYWHIAEACAIKISKLHWFLISFDYFRVYLS